MAERHVEVPRAPQVRAVRWSDIGDALRAGWRDFLSAPQYGLFFGAIFALGGLFIFWVLSATDQLWLALPVAIGFPLIGPFVATGLYEVSHRLQSKQPLSWRAVLFTVFLQRERQMGWMAFVVLFVFWIWLYQVRILIALFLGSNAPASFQAFFEITLFTPSGLTFLAVGTLVGAILALILFTLTVISMPLLLDTELDFVTAMITSFKTVTTSPIVMLGWGVIVTLISIASMIPAFLGLLVALPVLGHATWHLYKAATIPTH